MSLVIAMGAALPVAQAAPSDAPPRTTAGRSDRKIEVINAPLQVAAVAPPADAPPAEPTDHPQGWRLGEMALALIGVMVFVAARLRR